VFVFGNGDVRTEDTADASDEWVSHGSRHNSGIRVHAKRHNDLAVLLRELGADRAATCTP
jgi:hypothetical protein